MSENFSAKIAEAYDIHAHSYAATLEPILSPMADEIVRLAEPMNRERVLDLATGTGLIARALARSATLVIAVDLSLGILALAHEMSEGELSFVAGNAQQMPFRDSQFDLITCGLSLSHFPDASTALAEIRRLLRPGGRFITSAWGKEGESPTKEAAAEVQKKYLEGRDEVFGEGFNEEIWADADRGCQTLRQAGFADVRVQTSFLAGKHRTPQEAIKIAFAWPLTRYRLSRLAPEEQRKLQEETVTAVHDVTDLRWRSEMHYYMAVLPAQRETS